MKFDPTVSEVSLLVFGTQCLISSKSQTIPRKASTRLLSSLSFHVEGLLFLRPTQARVFMSKWKRFSDNQVVKLLQTLAHRKKVGKVPGEKRQKDKRTMVCSKRLWNNWFNECSLAFTKTKILTTYLPYLLKHRSFSQQHSIFNQHRHFIYFSLKSLFISKNAIRIFYKSYFMLIQNIWGYLTSCRIGLKSLELNL